MGMDNDNMLIHYHYTETELKQLLSSMTIIIDTREQSTQHITGYLDAKKIPWLSQKLDVADYSAMLPANPELGIVRDTYFPVAIERKNSLEELSACFTTDRTRFESELIRSGGITLTLLVENSSYQDISSHNYKTELNEKSFMGSLIAFKHRYKIDVQFIPKELAGQFIAQHFYYYLRERLK